MIPERQRIVIAELCGLEKIDPKDWWGWCFAGIEMSGDMPSMVKIPDYLNDLDTAIPAVRQIIGASGYSVDTFAEILAQVCGCENNDSESDREFSSFDFILAPPEKWCEAILKWSNKWEETTP